MAGDDQSLCYVANEWYVITFNNYPADVPSCRFFALYLSCFIKYHIHELIETLKQQNQRLY